MFTMRGSNRRRFAFVCHGDVSDGLLRFLDVSVMESCGDADGVMYCYVNLSKRVRVSRLLSSINVWNRKPDTAKIFVSGEVEVFPVHGVPFSPILDRIHSERGKSISREESTYRTWSR